MPQLGVWHCGSYVDMLMLYQEVIMIDLVRIFLQVSYLDSSSP